MTKDLYEQVSRELYNLTKDRTYLREFIDKDLVNKNYRNQNTNSQFKTFIEITDSAESDFKDAVYNWGEDDSRWNEALELAKKNQLKSTSSNSTGQQNQYVLRMAGLKQVSSSGFIQNLPTGYVKLNIDGNGQINKNNVQMSSNFLKKLGQKLSGNRDIVFDDKLFTLTQDKDEATYLSEEDTKSLTDTIKELIKINKASDFDNDINKSGMYYGDNSTTIVQDKIESDSLKIDGSVSADFVINTYLAKKLGKLLLDENTTDSQILEKAKQVDTSGIIKSYLKNDTNITNSVIFTVIRNIHNYTTDDKEVGETLRTIYSLTKSDEVDFNLQSFTDPNKFSIRIVLSGLLNKVTSNKGDNATYYEKILTQTGKYSSSFNDKIEDLIKSVEGLSNDDICRWVVLEQCDGVGSQNLLNQIREYCLGNISKHEFISSYKNLQIKSFNIEPSNKDKCSLRSVNDCDTYWNVFINKVARSNESNESQLKLYLGFKDSIPLSLIKKNTYETKEKVTLTKTKEDHISFGFSTKTKLKFEGDNLENLLSENVHDLFTKFSKDHDYIYLAENKEFTFTKITVTLKEDNKGVKTVEKIDFVEADLSIDDDQPSKTNSQNDISQNDISQNASWVKIKAVNDIREFDYKVSPNGKVYYRQGSHDSNSHITYVTKLDGNIYCNINSADAHKLDTNLPSDDEIKKTFITEFDKKFKTKSYLKKNKSQK